MTHPSAYAPAPTYAPDAQGGDACAYAYACTPARVQEAGSGAGGYRYAFNGKEDDDATGWQDYGFRNYLKTIGRFASVDPLTHDYPHYSPYQFAGNMPIMASDVDGLEPYVEMMEDGSTHNLSIRLVDAPAVYAYSIRQTFLHGLSRGMSVRDSRKATQILRSGGSDPVTRALAERFWRGSGPMSVAGEVDFTGVRWGLDGMAADVSTFATVSMGVTLAAPVVSAVGTVGGGAAALEASASAIATKIGFSFGALKTAQGLTSAAIDVTLQVGAINASPDKTFASDFNVLSPFVSGTVGNPLAAGAFGSGISLSPDGSTEFSPIKAAFGAGLGHATKIANSALGEFGDALNDAYGRQVVEGLGEFYFGTVGTVAGELVPQDQ